MTSVIEFLSAAFGIFGTVLLALNGRRAGWGFVAYLASNIGWIWFAAVHQHWALLAQQLAFLVSSLVGIWVWLVRPWWRQRMAELADLFPLTGGDV